MILGIPAGAWYVAELKNGRGKCRLFMVFFGYYGIIWGFVQNSHGNCSWDMFWLVEMGKSENSTIVNKIRGTTH